MCGGVFTIAARSDCVVSPVRTAAVMRGASSPISSAMRRIPLRGSARFLWMSALSALSGETYTTRTSSGSGAVRPSWKRSSSAVRNAASVFPEPVGAAISVWRRSRMAAQPWRWAAVGSPRVSENQRCRTGWNRDRGIGDLDCIVHLMRRLFAFAVLLLLASAALAETTTVILVRHAERVDKDGDVPLIEPGFERAKELARVLADARVSAIYVTQWQRTLQTVEPLLAALKLEPVKFETGANYARDIVADIRSKHAGK